MNESHELYNKITKELLQKRKDLLNAKQKIEQFEEISKRLTKEIMSIEKMLTTKKEELEILSNKNNNKLLYKFYIPNLILSLIPSLVTAFLTVKLLITLNSLNIIIYILSGILIGILGIIIPAFIGPIIIRKIFLEKIKKLQEEVISSQQYQELLKETKKLENELSIKKSLQKSEQNNINNAQTEYNVISTEITMKETLLRYLKYEKKVELNNNQTEEEQNVTNKKVLQRVLKKD